MTFGDSITDGFVSKLGVPLFQSTTTFGKDERYPDFLARRLLAAHHPISVVNAGISGNRLLSDGFFPGGPSGLSRLQRDVVEVAGATDVLLLIGINDLGTDFAPRPDAVIAGLKTTVDQLKRAGLRVIVGTLVPSKGFGMGSLYRVLGDLDLGFLHGRASVDAARQKVNQWIRGSGVPDAVVDFDVCLRDPAAPSYLRPEFDSGDHIHPNAEGYEAMANCVDLRLLP